MDWTRNKSDKGLLFVNESNTAPPRDVPWYPDVRELQPDNLQLLRSLRQQVSDELGPNEVVSDLDLVHFALRELSHALKSSAREDKILRFLFMLLTYKKPINRFDERLKQ